MTNVGPEAAQHDEAARRRLRIRRAAGFVVAGGLTLFLALDGGGYDLVLRHEVGLAVWLLIAGGLATGVLPRARLSRPALVALGGFAMLVALMVLASGWTESDEFTAQAAARALQYLGFVALAFLALNRHTWQGAAAGLATAALIVPFFSLGSWLFPDLLPDEVPRAFGFDRLSFPLDYWNAVSCWGAMAIAIGLSVSAHANSRLLRALGLAALPVAALTVHLTYSRFGIAAGAIAVVAAFALARHRITLSLNAAIAAVASGAAILAAREESEIVGSSDATIIAVLAAGALACALAAFATVRVDSVTVPRRIAQLALAGAMVIALLGAAVGNGRIADAWDEFKTQRTVPTGTDSSSRLSSFGGNRYDLWVAGFDAFKTDPGRGIGPGSYEFYWAREGKDVQFVRNPHSLYLQQLAELGVFGLVAILAALGGLLVAAIGARRRWSTDRDLAAGTGLIASFVVFLAYAGIDWMWELSSVGLLALGGAAVAGAGGLDRAAARRPGRWLRVGAVAVALIAAAAQVPGLVSTERVRASNDALANGDAERAIELADAGVAAQPWAASAYAARAAAKEDAGKTLGAQRDIEQAISREPTNWRYQLQLARFMAARGDSLASRAAVERARELNPRSPFLSAGSPFLAGLDQLLSSSGP